MRWVLISVFCIAYVKGLILPEQQFFTPAIALKPTKTFLPQPINLANLTQHGKCECTKKICGCCANFDLKKLNFNHTGCMNFTYVPSDFAIQMDLLISNSSIFNARVSGKNPPALCIPIPQLPILSMCIRLTDIYTEEQSIHACMNMELQLQGNILAIFSFDCAKLSPNGIILVKPDPKVPSDNGQLDLDLSLKNLEDVLRGNSTNTNQIGWPSLFDNKLAPKLSNETLSKIVEAVNNILRNETNVA